MTRAPLQLSLPFRSSARGDEVDCLSARLRPLLGDRFHSLVLTENRSTFLSARTIGENRALALRLHRGFVDAPNHVLAMVATYCQSSQRRQRSEALSVLRAFFDTLAPPARRCPPRRLQSDGEHHDLLEIFDEVNRQYFGGRLRISITWGDRRRAARRRSRSKTLQLGSYCWDDNLIRIHPVLDHADVPRLVIAAIVHHEMLHATIPPRRVGGRRQVHTAEFRRREGEFENLEKADRWLEGSLSKLLRRRDRDPG